MSRFWWMSSNILTFFCSLLRGFLQPPLHQLHQLLKSEDTAYFHLIFYALFLYCTWIWRGYLFYIWLINQFLTEVGMILALFFRLCPSLITPLHRLVPTPQKLIWCLGMVSSRLPLPPPLQATHLWWCTCYFTIIGENTHRNLYLYY